MQDGNVRLCDFGSCVIGRISIRNAEEKAAAEEIILKETTQMYRSPELVDLYMREVLTEKSDIWVRNYEALHETFETPLKQVIQMLLRFSVMITFRLFFDGEI